jgi:hypothetical protein
MSAARESHASRLEECIKRLRRGELDEDDLRALASGCRQMQDLLYLQAGSTSPLAQVHGISLFAGGKQVPMPRDPAEWPYRRVIDAVADGWRIVCFPNQALLLDESRTYGLGCEFILERWSEEP